MTKAFNFTDLSNNCLCAATTEDKQMLLELSHNLTTEDKQMLPELPHNLQVVSRYSGFFLDTNLQPVAYITLAIYVPYNSNDKRALQNCSFVPESLGGL